MDRRAAPWLVGLLLASTTVGVARTQPRLAAVVHDVKQREEVYVLPPPDVLRVATLGYRAAVTDQLWAKLLVEYGVHLAERRPFPDMERYLDAIVALEPNFGILYEFVDTLLCYRPGHGTEADALAARRYLERGLIERPYDPKVWQEYGQFLAFIGPSFLKGDDDKERWRKDGALALAHAVELGADPGQTLAAATLLDERGQRDAAIRSLRRAYALADDERTREQIALKLQRYEERQEQDAAQQVVQAFESRWRVSLPFVSRTEFLLLGPIADPLACVGPAQADARECARDWDRALPAPK